MRTTLALGGANEAAEFVASVRQIAAFSGDNLAARVAALEETFTGLNKVGTVGALEAASIDAELFDASRIIKRASAQIDVVVHALGILTLLPSILQGDEVVQSLSLGAGNAEARRFDLETNRRVAEFTFIEWRGNDSTRLQKIFKDFYRLAEFATSKMKELWVTDDKFVLEYLKSGSSIRGATNKHRNIWEDIQREYPSFKRVNDYYNHRIDQVNFRVIDRDACSRAPDQNSKLSSRAATSGTAT
jgi:hypothetical protein